MHSAAPLNWLKFRLAYCCWSLLLEFDSGVVHIVCCWSLTLVFSESALIREMQEPEERPSKPAFCGVGYPKRPCLHDCTEVKWNGKIGFWYHLISIQIPSYFFRWHCATEYDSSFQKFDFLQFGAPDSSSAQVGDRLRGCSATWTDGLCGGSRGLTGCLWAPVWFNAPVGEPGRWL